MSCCGRTSNACGTPLLPAPPPIGPDADWAEFGLFRIYLGILGRYPDQQGFEFYSARLGAYTLGIALAFVSPVVSLALYALTALFYALPLLPLPRR